MTALLGAGVSAAAAIERLPVELFAKPPLTSQARLAPDGKHLAFLREFQNRTLVHIADLDANKLTRLDPGNAELADDKRKGVAEFQWVSDKRLLMFTTVDHAIYGAVASDWDGNNAIPFGGYEDNKIPLNGLQFFATEVIHRFFDADQSVLMLDRHADNIGNSRHPDIMRLSTESGTRRTVLKNPGEVAEWSLDPTGVARLGILSHGQQSGAIYRAAENSPWRTILPLKKRDGEMQPFGFDVASNRIFVSDLNAEKRWAFYALDPESGALSEPLVTDSEYDIIPRGYVPEVDGIPLAGPIFSEQKHTLLGIRYYTDAARVKWLDKDFARYQAAVDKSLPNTVNLLVDQSRDGTRLLWFAFSDQNPGSYHLLDLAKKTFKPMGVVCPWIDPAKMAPIYAVKYQARDGLTVHGYLTVPAGYEAKQLPLVVMPHGGPWVRDVWGYDPLVQLLANRGYAVLRMNYRGSTGYGFELAETAKREVGGKIQDDIEDGTRWAIAAGVADPKRIAIFGGSYGGYSTLFALGHNPELYRCGISLAGVTDWYAIYSQNDVADNRESLRYWREQIGDPRKDQEMLKSISPVYFADKIVAPVFIIQGKEDRRVPPAQARAMIAALEKCGRKPESMFISNLGHSYGFEQDRINIFNAITAFLEKNLGPGVE